MTCKITAALSAVTLLLSVSFPAGASAASGGQQFGVYANGYPSAAEVDTMARGGVRWLRVVFPFVQIGAQPEKWDWSGTDAIVAEATSAGIRVLPVLFTVPSWLASKENRAPVHNRRARRAWSNFAAASARRYGHNGTFWKGHPTIAYRPITTWQAWNEPNLPFFWGGSPNVGRYVQLLRITRRSLRRSARSGCHRWPVPLPHPPEESFDGRLHAAVLSVSRGSGLFRHHVDSPVLAATAGGVGHRS